MAESLLRFLAAAAPHYEGLSIATISGNILSFELCLAHNIGGRRNQ